METKSKHPKIFLVLSGLMVVVAVGAYVFEEELFDLFYQEYTFLLIVTVSVLLALFFLYAYRFPRIGLTLLGRSVELPERKSDAKGVNVEFSNLGNTATDHKRAMSRVKKARHMRKQTARVTREMQSNAKEDD